MGREVGSFVVVVLQGVHPYWCWRLAPPAPARPRVRPRPRRELAACPALVPGSRLLARRPSEPSPNACRNGNCWDVCDITNVTWLAGPVRARPAWPVAAERCQEEVGGCLQRLAPTAVSVRLSGSRCSCSKKLKWRLPFCECCNAE